MGRLFLWDRRYQFRDYFSSGDILMWHRNVSSSVRARPSVGIVLRASSLVRTINAASVIASLMPRDIRASASLVQRSQPLDHSVVASDDRCYCLACIWTDRHTTPLVMHQFDQISVEDIFVICRRSGLLRKLERILTVRHSKSKALLVTQKMYLFIPFPTEAQMGHKPVLFHLASR